MVSPSIQPPSQKVILDVPTSSRPLVLWSPLTPFVLSLPPAGSLHGPQPFSLQTHISQLPQHLPKELLRLGHTPFLWVLITNGMKSISSYPPLQLHLSPQYISNPGIGDTHLLLRDFAQVVFLLGCPPSTVPGLTSAHHLRLT